MRIDSYAVAMSASTKTTEIHHKEESLKVWAGSIPEADGLLEDVINISDDARNLLATSNLAAGTAVEEKGEIKLKISEKDKQKLLLIQKMLEKLTGKKLRFCIPEEITIRGQKENTLNCSWLGNTMDNSQPVRGWGLEYSYSESHYEKQTLFFRSEGIIRTADSREINFSIELNMSREFASRININIRGGDAAKDPLVINFSGTAPALNGEKISFDIDCDGRDDTIPFLAPGSGFLVLDLNEDGIINNGSEMFGPQSGNGFEELSQYDEDRNNWIDENDPIYNRLRIWTKDETGKNVLLALGIKGIGAIYLGNTGTYFEMKNAQNELLGKIQKTGIFIREDGTAGTVQYIDLSL